MPSTVESTPAPQPTSSTLPLVCGVRVESSSLLPVSSASRLNTPGRVLMVRPSSWYSSQYAIEMTEIAGCQPVISQRRLAEVTAHPRAPDQHLAIRSQAHLNMRQWRTDGAHLALLRCIQVIKAILFLLVWKRQYRFLIRFHGDISSCYSIHILEIP